VSQPDSEAAALTLPSPAPRARSLPDGPALLVVADLAKTYADGTEALRGIDLELGSGMFGVLGPNGAGKTTLLSIIALVQEPSRGERRYAGLDPRRPRERAAARRLLGSLPQEFAPLGTLSGEEYLVHCGRLRRPDLSRRQVVERAHRLLAAVDLERASHRPSGTYSGGMKRRLGLAQALIHEPKIVIVDEPTAGLDPEERIRFRTLIAGVAEDTLVLLSTHIVEDIESTCPRLAIITRGTLMYLGEPGPLMQRAAGKLWLIPSGVGLPPGAIALSQRAVSDAESATLVVTSDPGPVATPYETTLEAAYAAFIATAA
jgi:ABC-2 type transport system ATP-binding protein